jgi:hypothetical protein
MQDNAFSGVLANGDTFGTISGAMFRASTSASDTDFQAITSDGSSETITDTGVPIDTNLHLFRVYFPDTSHARFYIDGNLVATNTTHLPTDAQFWTVQCTALANVGAYFYFIRIDQEFN